MMIDGRVAARKRAAFLRALGQMGHVAEAAARSGVSKATLYFWRRRDADFAARWRVAADAGAATIDARAKGGVAPDAVGTAYWSGKGGRMRIVRINDTSARWSEGAQAIFLEHLAATANVRASAKAAGFTPIAIYRRRMKDRVFAELWAEAQAQGVARVEMLLIDAAGRAIENVLDRAPGVEPPMSVSEAIAVVRLHRQSVSGGPPTRRNWRLKAADPQAARESILRKLDAIRTTRAVRGG